MKRTIISCLMAVGVWLTATAANTVTLTSAQGHPGDEVEIAVMLTTTDEVTAIELLVPLGDKLSYVEGSAVINAECANGHTLSAAEQDGKLSMVIFSPTLATLKGVDGELCRFKLKLGKEPAGYLLVPEVVMSDASGKAITSSVVNGMVTLLSPKIEVTTPTIDYGRVPIRSTYTQTLSVKNVGNEPLEIMGIAFDNADLSASSVPCTITAGSTKNFTLTYAPLQRGTITSNVTITSNAINPKAGKAMVKAQPYSVNELHVQRVEGVSDEEVTVVLKMNNMEPIAGAQCEFTLPDALKYVEGSAAVGGRCEATDHQVSGAKSGKVLTLFMYSATNQALPEGDGELMTFRVRLDGASGSYQLNPTDVVLSNVTMENMVSATSNNYVVISSPKISANNSIDLGRVAVTEKATATYSIRNSGKVDLVISKATFLAEGYAVETELPLTIARSKTKEITVSYTPTVEGEHETTMQLYTNDPTCRMKSVAVSGSVYEPNHLLLDGENTATGYRVSFALDNYTEIVAVQMNVRWLPGMKTSMAAMQLSERLKSHAHMVTDLGGGVYQVLIYSMANQPILGNSGELFTLEYTAEEGTAYRDTKIQVTDIVLSDAKGTNYVSSEEVAKIASFSNFHLSFVVEDEIIREQFVKAGNAITAPEVAQREGYTFTWTGLQQTMPNADLVVTGSYNANSYTVTYVVDGEVYKTESVVYGSTIELLDAPTKEGHTFSGWSETPETMPAKDVVISGSFTINSYTLTYTVDGVEYKTDTIVYGAELTVLPEPVKEGYTFSSWSDIPATMPAEDVIISGDFIINKYLVTFKIDGEVLASDSLEYGATIVAPEVSEKEGHTFTGWGEVAETVPATDVTYEGCWLVNSYLLSYVVDGETVQSDSVAYGTAIVALEEPVKEGYTFSGWSYIPATMPAEDVIISGDFIINKYLVTFKIGDEVIFSDSLEYGASIVVPEAPEREGYTFDGWGEVAETVPAGDVIYEGSYSVNSYLLTYMVDGETIQVDSIAYGTEITLLDELVKEGYTFSGWGEVPATMPAEDVTITGFFTINKYLVTFVIDDEVIASDSIEYNAEIIVPEAPVKEGYTFSGWGEVPATMPAEDVKISGSFTPNIYKVYYYVDEELVHTAEVACDEVIPEYVYEPTVKGEVFVGWIGEAYETMPAHDITYKAEIEIRFITLTIDQYGSGTFCSIHDLDFSEVEGLKAYVATGYNTATGVVTLTRVMSAKSGEGLFLKGQPGDYEVPTLKSSESCMQNLLVGALDNTIVNSTCEDGLNANYEYKAKGNDTTPVFYSIVDGSVQNAGKAYLQLPKAWIGETTRTIGLCFDDEEMVSGDEEQPAIPAVIYDLQGRRVMTPTKGAFIVNGKKIVFK